MANIKQQKKRILVAERQRMENIRYRSSIKTAFRRIVEAVQSGDQAAVDAAHGAFVALVDRAAAKRALHPNTAARKKARATRVIARGPQVEEAKKRRVSRKAQTRAKAVAPAEAAVVEEAPVEEAPVEEAAAEEAPAEEAAAVEAPAEEPAAEEAPAKPKRTRKPKASEEPAPEGEATADDAS